MKRILIAEDDADIRQALVDLLEGEGYGVTAVGDGAQAIDAWRAAKDPFDLLLLDVMMPEKSGYDVCRTVRAAGSSVAVLMLSAKGAEIDKVVGLELGADDYVTKPFGVRELLARITAALRRSAPLKASGPAAEDFDFAGAAVSVKRYSLQGPKGVEPVTDIEMKLTRVFAAHRDEVLSRDALLNVVWGQDYFGTTRTLDQHVANLRRKLEKVGGRSQAIGTVHGVGYRYLGLALMLLALAGCRSSRFAVVNDAGRPSVLRISRQVDEKTSVPRRLVISPDDAVHDPRFADVSGDLIEVLDLDRRGEFVRAYEMLLTNATPFAKALRANYERYSRPGLWDRTDPAVAERLCREVIEATTGSTRPADRLAEAEAWLLRPSGDYGTLATNCLHGAAAKHADPQGRTDPHYAGGVFGEAFPWPPNETARKNTDTMEKALREAAIRGNERARRAFDNDGTLDLAVRDYRFAAYAQPYYWFLYPYLPLEGAPGFGRCGRFSDYEVLPKLQVELDRYGLEAHWFEQGHPLDGDVKKTEYEKKLKHFRSRYKHKTRDNCDASGVDRVPFLMKRGRGTKELPLVVFLPGNGEMGTDLLLQFRQRAVIETVTSAEFQAKRPCHFVLPMPPSFANVNGPVGYPHNPDGDLQKLYADLVFQLMREGLRVDRRRIYLVGLGSGGTAAIALALTYPGRYAAVQAMFTRPYVDVVHPRRPGAWHIGQKESNRQYEEEFVPFKTAVERAGGEFVVEYYSESAGECWWDAPWRDDSVWDWLFSKQTEGEVYR